MTTTTPSPRVAEKALRILAEHRVTQMLDHSRLVIRGDTAFYTVTALVGGVRCDCDAGRNRDPVSCSHKVAAQIAWQEQRS
jgi:hypothetical protein